jgi:hypothetical protein
VIVTCVLLKVAFTCAIPRDVILLTFFLTALAMDLLHPLHGLLPGHRLARTLARARVRARALAAHRQPAAVAQPR